MTGDSCSRELGVLGGALRGEVAVGLGLLGTVAGGVAAGCDELGVGDPGGGGAEHDTEDGGEREDEPRAAEDGADARAERRRGEQDRHGDGEARAALPLPCGLVPVGKT